VRACSLPPVDPPGAAWAALHSPLARLAAGCRDADVELFVSSARGARLDVVEACGGG
jgi:hypothetical protein